MFRNVTICVGLREQRRRENKHGMSLWQDNHVIYHLNPDTGESDTGYY